MFLSDDTIALSQSNKDRRMKIDNIEFWKSLHHANGSCEGIPDAIDRLCLSDRNQRHKAYWEIENNVIIQGDLFAPSPFVVEELIHCLRSEILDREEIYDLLVQFVYGHSSDEKLMGATMNAVHSGLDIYLRDLGRSDRVMTRVTIANLLLGLSNHFSIAKGQVMEILKEERESEVIKVIDEIADRQVSE